MSTLDRTERQTFPGLGGLTPRLILRDRRAAAVISGAVLAVALSSVFGLDLGDLRPVRLSGPVVEFLMPRR